MRCRNYSLCAVRRLLTYQRCCLDLAAERRDLYDSYQAGLDCIRTRVELRLHCHFARSAAATSAARRQHGRRHYPLLPRLAERGVCGVRQVASFDLSSATVDPVYYDLSAAVSGTNFRANAVRVVEATETVTKLLVGGHDSSCCPASQALLLYVSIPAGSTDFNVTGSVRVPSGGSGVGSLSQTSALLKGAVLATTDQGVFKCASLATAVAPECCSDDWTAGLRQLRWLPPCCVLPAAATAMCSPAYVFLGQHHVPCRNHQPAAAWHGRHGCAA